MCTNWKDVQDHTIHGDQEYMLLGQHERATYANLEETMLKEMMDNVSSECETRPYIVHDHTMLLEYSLLLCSYMMPWLNFLQLPPPTQPRTHPGPLPDSTFIATAREAVASGPSVGTSIAQKAEQMKKEKLRQFEEKKEAEVLRKLQEADKKAQEKKAIAAEKLQRKKEAAEQKKLETQQRKAQAAEEKRKAQEEKKLAQAAAKAAAAEEKRIEQQKKKENQAAAKAATADRRSTRVGSSWTGYYPGTRTSMFDVFKD